MVNDVRFAKRIANFRQHLNKTQHDGFVQCIILSGL